MIENQNAYPMNLLVTLDRNYVPQLNVMLFSALQSDPAAFFDVYILHDEGLSASDLTATRALLGQRGALHLIRVDESGLTDAPTSDRYCGRNKPWKPGYVGELDVFYNETVSQMEKDLP